MFAAYLTNTWLVATILAVIGGAVGFFVVLRGSSFPAHAIPNSAFTGAAAANLLGIDPVIGLAVVAGAAATMISGLARRGRHDAVTALALVMGLAIGAAVLSRSGEYEPELFALLFGDILGVSSGEVVLTLALAVASVLAIIVLYRPLLLTSTVPEVAEARGVNGPRMELYFLLILAAATALTVPVVGALLTFSLMVGPPAAARAVTNRPPVAILLSVAVALVIIWASIALSFETNWPIGFFVGALGAVAYGVGRLWPSRRAVPVPA